MSIFFYIAGYILVSIGIAYFLKSRKSKVKEIKKQFDVKMDRKENLYKGLVIKK